MAVDSISISEFVSVLVPGNENNKISVKSFVESKGIKFSTGSGFYQLSKPEIIQLNKIILVQRLAEPNILVTGNSVRDVLKINDAKKKTNKFMVDEEILKEFKIFVQSTSYNRNLVGGTTFLYRKENSGVVSSSTTTRAAAASSTSGKKEGPSSPKISRMTQNVSVTQSTVSTTSTGASKPTISTTSTGAGKPTVSKTSTGAGISNKIEIVISFDTTASMFPCLSTVRSVIQSTLTRLTTSIPTIRIGILAHGDYDTTSTYVTCAANNYKLCGASQIDELVDFVKNVKPAGGGCTWPECYEYVLVEVATKFDWSADANKSLVLIGDAEPHEPHDNPYNIDWRVEAGVLKEKGIRIYSVQALGHEESEPFFQGLAQLTLGFHLRLHQFFSIADFLIAVCLHEGDNAIDLPTLELGGTNKSGLSDFTRTGHLAKFEEEISSSGRMVNNLRQLFDQLQGRSPTVPTASTTGLIPVNPSRFQVLNVDSDQAIKQFAENRGLVFKAGRGFYEFTKPESVSDKKEIVLMDKTTGEFYTGWVAARQLSGIDPGKPKEKQSPTNPDKYTVFIQSTSYNRKLIAGQKFLYEVDTEQ